MEALRRTGERASWREGEAVLQPQILSPPPLLLPIWGTQGVAQAVSGGHSCRGIGTLSGDRSCPFCSHL